MKINVRSLLQIRDSNQTEIYSFFSQLYCSSFSCMGDLEKMMMQSKGAVDNFTVGYKTSIESTN